MTRADAIVLLDRLHGAQNTFYSGGDDLALRELLAPEIAWTIPGSSPIAGTYHGVDDVLAYMRHRRELAAGTFRMHRRDVLAGDGDRIAALTDGSATIGGREHRWSTVGLYEVAPGPRPAVERIAACWLLALDQPAFDAIWSA